MRIAGEHSFDASRERVWAALHDPRMLAAALPGARRLEATGDDEYAITVDVGVGSVKGTYEGTFALTEQQAPESCTVTARASGRPGSVESVARMRLGARDGGGALLAYEADATVTGPLAGVGQRLIGGAARRTTEQFLTALDRTIAAPHEAAAAPREAAVPGRAIEPAPPVPAGADPRWIVAGAVAGAAAALFGVAVGRWTARR
jgi:carbon monoxide dehydrogenase subunit G